MIARNSTIINSSSIRIVHRGLPTILSKSWGSHCPKRKERLILIPGHLLQLVMLIFLYWYYYIDITLLILPPGYMNFTMRMVLTRWDGGVSSSYPRVGFGFERRAYYSCSR